MLPTAERIARQLTEACGIGIYAEIYPAIETERMVNFLLVDFALRGCEIGQSRRNRPGRATIALAEWTLQTSGPLDRRECLDHVAIFGERQVRLLLLLYRDHYKGARTHSSLNKDAPVSRAILAVGRISRRRFHHLHII
jgi:hypothetical protein